MFLSKQRKTEIVEEIKKDLAAYPVVGVACLQNLPTKQYNTLKKNVGEDLKVIMTRKTLMQRALDEAHVNQSEELKKRFEGSCALVFTKLPPFKLAKILRKNKSSIAAKPGMIAEEDLIAPAGETNLAPGPVLTELKKAGIQAKIQGPKVVIIKDATVVKKGEAVTLKQAAILTQLGMEPFKVGLKLEVLVENGMTYDSSVLDIDDAYYLDALKQAASQALNLSVFAGIYNKLSTPAILAKAVRQANALNGAIESKRPPAETTASTKEENASPTETASNDAEPAKKEEKAPATEDKAEEKPANVEETRAEKPAENAPATKEKKE
ncbi:MAG: 50S ribosomal protein L10 [Candidatus Micrarchaeia archaeon]